MKKLLGIITIALLATAWTCHAVDYSKHFYNQRVYRVALGSGTAPTAADMALVRLHNGDMVLNTDDNCLYIMHATNVYTKFTAAGAMDGAAVTNISAVNLAATTAASAINGAAITNLAGGNIASGDIGTARISAALGGTAGTNIAGNIPIAALTNAVKIGGLDISLAAMTNAAGFNASALYTGTFTNTDALDTSTNVIVVINGVIVSVTTTP